MRSVSALFGPAIVASLFALVAGGGHRYPLRPFIGPPTVWNALAMQGVLLILGPLVASVIARGARLPLTLAAAAGGLVPITFAVAERARFGDVSDSVVGGPLEVIIGICAAIFGYLAFPHITRLGIRRTPRS